MIIVWRFGPCTYRVVWAQVLVHRGANEGVARWGFFPPLRRAIMSSPPDKTYCLTDWGEVSRILSEDWIQSWGSGFLFHNSCRNTLEGTFLVGWSVLDGMRLEEGEDIVPTCMQPLRPLVFHPGIANCNYQIPTAILPRATSIQGRMLLCLKVWALKKKNSDSKRDI